MDFNIRAISLATSVASDARCAVADWLGKEVAFRSGTTLALKLPEETDQFLRLPEPERLLTSLGAWVRVFKYPVREGDSIHVLAPAESVGDEILFYRVDLVQQPAPSRRARRPPVEIISGAVMPYEECATWLIDLSALLADRPDEKLRQTILCRPRELTPKPIRVAWVGPEILDGVAMPRRLNAIGASMVRKSFTFRREATATFRLE